jgi:lysyl oxidase
LPYDRGPSFRKRLSKDRRMMESPGRSPARPRFRTLAVALAALAIVASPPAAAGAVSPDLLPDLVAPSPTSPWLAVTRLGDGQDHLLLRFDGFIHNIGAGALEIRGSQPSNSLMTVTGQRIYREDGSYRDDNSRHPQIQFENADGHNHWHLKGAARFSLWNEGGTTQVASGAKVGFCLQDVEPVDAFASSRVYSSAATEYCKEAQPNASQVFEGISSGWQDVYAAKLPFQWVDVSNVSPGRDRLGAQVDPDNFVLEGNEANNGPTLAGETVTVPGYAPVPMSGIESQPQAITLGAQPYGSPGPPVFKIESGPRHGTLSAPAGAPLAGAQVAYVPNRGYAGPDSFTFSARDASSPFPVQAPVAAVTIPANPRLQALARLPLLTKLRFLRRGRFLLVRARAQRTGMLRIRIKKGKRRLGSCRKPARSGHRFRCAIRLRRHSSPSRARAIVSLLENGRAAAVDTFRLPRRLHRR